MATVTDLSGIQPTSPEMMGLNRQREMAKALMQQGMTPAQGQMVSGHYVANPWGNIANVFSAYQGKKLAEDADAKQTDMARQLREEGVRDMERATLAAQGQAAVPENLGGNVTLRDDEGNVMPGASAGRQAVAANPLLAAQILAGSRSPANQALGMEYLKGTKLNEGEIQTSPIFGERRGNQKYHAPTTIDLGDKVMVQYPDGRQVTMPKSQAGQVVETQDGHVLVNTRTGASTPITDATGKPVQGGKALTEVQSKDTGYYGRMQESDKILTSNEKEGVTRPGQFKTSVGDLVSTVPFVGEGLKKSVSDPLTNWTQSAKQQQVEQAQLNFITAVLRRESGAAISPTEFEKEAKKYFPQPGDSEENIAQKRQARQDAIDAVRISAGPGAKRWDESKATQTKVNALPAEQRAAYEWAKANPKDPRAAQILQKIGM